MGNLTLKKRNITANTVKNLEIQKVCGKYKKTYQSNFHTEWVENHYYRKPKTFSTRNWMFPVLMARFEKEARAEEIYVQFKEWLNNQTQEVEVEISCKLQHLAMCFDSPHFISCGSPTGSNFQKANYKMLHSNVFCIFTRDRRGLISNRCICTYHSDKIQMYSFYGSNYYLESMFVTILNEVFKLPIVRKNSFL